MPFDRRDYDNDQLLTLYKALLKPRLIEEKMLILLRQGKISKWFSGIGQEAIAVGSTLALNADEYILPLHRNLGVFTGRGVPLGQLFAQWEGKAGGFTKGRDRSFHFGSREHHIVGMISHLGPQLAVADGIALADVLDGAPRMTLVYSGDGGASEGDFHEALNVAAVWQLPVIFLVENNGYGLSTPSNEQFHFDSFTTKGPAYGMEAVQIDGNNVLDVYTTIGRLAADLRQNPRPVLVEALTFRMRGHEEASGTKYVPPALFAEWAAKDPVTTYEQWLLAEGILSETARHQFREKIREEIEAGLREADALPAPLPDAARELADMYAPVGEASREKLEARSEELEAGRDDEASRETSEEIEKVEAMSEKSKADRAAASSLLASNSSLLASANKRFVDAISDGLWQSMARYSKLVLMGQDIAEYGGVFKVTEDFVAEFGKARVRNTPLLRVSHPGGGAGVEHPRQEEHGRNAVRRLRDLRLQSDLSIT